MGWLDNWKEEGKARIDVIPRGYMDVSNATFIYDKSNPRLETYVSIALSTAILSRIVASTRNIIHTLSPSTNRKNS